MAKSRGVFERPPGSGIWWIHYYENGRRHREKVGRKSDATALYQKRKADARAGVKLPEFRKKAVLVKELLHDAVAFVKSHRTDVRNYVSRAGYLEEGLGGIHADELKPKDILNWLNEECSTPATFNRYKSVISLAYKIGISNSKASTNPARLVAQKRESSGRIRYLSREESAKLEGVLRENWPQHLDTFLVSIHTGMRLSEQFGIGWNVVDLSRPWIDLRKTKNFTPRVIPLNSVAAEALRRQKEITRDDTRIFRHSSQAETADVRSWFPEALELAGIKDYSWHCNRHTFCSWMVMAGVPLKVVQEVAGHKTISMTARYAHMAPDFTANEVERMVNPTATSTSTSAKASSKKKPSKAS